jgi:hypothetical protein
MARLDIDALFFDLLLPSDPSGDYLISEADDIRLLLRISEGEPEDGAMDPAPFWWLRLPEPA